jgi:hypothetical protein
MNKSLKANVRGRMVVTRMRLEKWTGCCSEMGSEDDGLDGLLDVGRRRFRFTEKRRNGKASGCHARW